MRTLAFVFTLLSFSLFAAPPPIARTGLTTNAGKVVVTQTNWPGFVSNVFNVLQFGAKGDNSHDDTAAIQAAMNAAYQGGTILFHPGIYRVTSTLTNKLSTKGMVMQGVHQVKAFATIASQNPKILWVGPTNGTLLSLDCDDSPVFRNLNFETGLSNAAAKLVKIDQTSMGGGSMTDWLFDNCSFATTHTDPLHRFIACEVSPTSIENCEDGRWLNCYFQGFGASLQAATNNSFGIVIGGNPNALNLFANHIYGVYFTNFIVMTNGSFTINDVLTSGNAVEIEAYTVIDWLNVSCWRAETFRQFFVGQAGYNSGARFDNIGVADRNARDINYPVFEITGNSKLQFNKIIGDGILANYPFIRFTGGGVSSHITQLSSVTTSTNDMRDFYTITQTGYIDPNSEGDTVVANSYATVFSGPIAFRLTNWLAASNGMTVNALGDLSFGEANSRLGIGVNPAIGPSYPLHVKTTSPTRPVEFFFEDYALSPRMSLRSAGGPGDIYTQVSTYRGNAGIIFFDFAGSTGAKLFRIYVDDNQAAFHLGSALTGKFWDSGGNTLASWNNSGLFTFNSNITMHGSSITLDGLPGSGDFVGLAGSTLVRTNSSGGAGDVTTAQLNTASNVLQVATSNNVRVAASTGISVGVSGSGGVTTYTVASTVTATPATAVRGTNGATLFSSNSTEAVISADLRPGSNVSLTTNAGGSITIAAASIGGGTGNVSSASTLTSGNLIQGGGGNNVSATTVAANTVATFSGAALTNNVPVVGAGGNAVKTSPSITLDNLTVNGGGSLTLDTITGVPLRTDSLGKIDEMSLSALMTWDGTTLGITPDVVLAANNFAADNRIVVADGGGNKQAKTSPAAVDTGGNFYTPGSFNATNQAMGSLSLTNPVNQVLNINLYATNGTPSNGAIVWNWFAATLGGTNVFIPLYK